MECSNCGSIYERRAVKNSSDIKAKFCEVCGEELVPEEIFNEWDVKLVEKFEKPEFISVNSRKKNIKSN